MENAKGYPFSEQERLRHRAKWESANAESIVRNMRKRVAATRVEPGDRMAWLNLKLMSSVSPLALGSANNAA